MDTAKAILEVSYRLFVEKGYEATNIREICKEVGIGMPTIYYHFQSKENLFYKAYDEYAAKYLEHYESRQVIHEKVNAEFKLISLFKEDVDYVAKNKTLFKFHVRYKFFPPAELYHELNKKQIEYSNRRDNIIMDILQQGAEEGVFKNINLDYFLKSYRKFVFDNMIGVVFLEDENNVLDLEAAWRAFIAFNSKSN